VNLQGAEIDHAECSQARSRVGHACDLDTKATEAPMACQPNVSAMSLDLGSNVASCAGQRKHSVLATPGSLSLEVQALAPQKDFVLKSPRRKPTVGLLPALTVGRSEQSIAESWRIVDIA